MAIRIMSNGLEDETLYKEDIAINLAEKGYSSIIASNKATFGKRSQHADFVPLLEDTDIQIYVDLDSKPSELLFSGKITDDNTTRVNTRITANYTAADILRMNFAKEFDKDIVRTNENWWGLFQELLGMMGISPQYSDTPSFSIAFICWKKGNKIIDEIKKMLECVQGRIFSDKKGIMRFCSGNSAYIAEGINFSEVNLIGDLVEKTEKNDKNKVVVTYTNFKELTLQKVFEYPSAKGAIRVAANAESVDMEISYNYSFVNAVREGMIQIEDPNGVILVLSEAGERKTDNANITYTLELTNSKATLKIINNSDVDIYITKLSIMGKPVVKHDGNTLQYGDYNNDELYSNPNPVTISNEYIQNTDAALICARIAYKTSLAKKTVVEFETNESAGYDILYACNVANSGIAYPNTRVVISSIDYKIKSGEAYTVTAKIKAKKLTDFALPAHEYTKISETISSSQSVNVDDAVITNTTNIALLGIAYAVDTSDTPNLYQISIDDYAAHDPRVMMKFLSKNANTGASKIKINNLEEKYMKKCAYTKDLVNKDILEGMIVVVNYNPAHDCYELINPVGISNDSAQWISDVISVNPGLTLPVPVAAFKQSGMDSNGVTIIDAPTTVEFYDLSSGSPYDFEWDFGDGTTSTERHPGHLYSTPGEYSVKLKAINYFGENTIIKNNIIKYTANSGLYENDFFVVKEILDNSWNHLDATVINSTTGSVDISLTNWKDSYVIVLQPKAAACEFSEEQSFAIALTYNYDGEPIPNGALNTVGYTGTIGDTAYVGVNLQNEFGNMIPCDIYLHTNQRTGPVRLAINLSVVN